MLTLTRRMLVVLLAAVLFVTVSGIAGASRSQTEMMADESMFFGLCAAAGGHAETLYYTDSSGELGYIVVCRGGLLDGESCVIDPAITFCSWGRVFEVAPDMTVSVITPEIKPLEEEPAHEPVDSGAVIQPVDISDGGESAPETTPAPEVDPVVDPVIDEPVVSDGEALPEPTAEPTVVIDPVLDSPLVDGAEVAPETDSGSGGQVIIDGPLSDLLPEIKGDSQFGDR